MKQINYAPETGWNWGWIKSQDVIAEVDSTVETTAEILQESPKMQAWKKWLQEVWYALGRKEGDIEINGDVVTVKIQGFNHLVFNPAEYKIGNQRWTSNDKKWEKQWSGNKFSAEDFKIFIEFLWGEYLNGILYVWKETVVYLRDIISVPKQWKIVFWSSNHGVSSNIWALIIGDYKMELAQHSENDSWIHSIF